LLWASSASYTFQLSVSYTTMRAFKKLLSGKTHVYLFKNSASQKRQREAILREKIQCCQLFPIFFDIFNSWENASEVNPQSTLGFFNNWIGLQNWQNCKCTVGNTAKGGKKRNRKTWMRCCIDLRFEEKSVNKGAPR